MAFSFLNTRLFVLESNVFLRQNICRLLKAHGFDTIESDSDGERAFERLLDREFDIVILNEHLNTVGGLQLTKMLCSCSSHTVLNPAIILLMSCTDEILLQKAFDDGASAAMLYPFPVKDLMPVIMAVIKEPKTCVRSGTYIGPDRRMRSRIEENESSNSSSKILTLPLN